MKIDFNKILLDIKKNEIKDGDKSATLKDVCVNALLNLIPNENMEGVKKFELWKIAKAIQESAAELEISIEDVAILKERVGKIYFPSIVGAVYSLLEKN